MNVHEHQTKQTYGSYTIQPFMNFWLCKIMAMREIRYLKGCKLNPNFFLTNLRTWSKVSKTLFMAPPPSPLFTEVVSMASQRN